ncbi:MAG: His/Gly/Thr/Pro-type tRNA ligase C-terminal domain-containing protein, partial [Actinomycetota bacterium]
LIEHYAGAFPLWLAPVQVVVLPVADRHNEYAEAVASKLEAAGIRVERDYRKESVGKKIRDAEMEKVPYMLVVGDKEEAAGTVAVRSHRDGDMGAATVEELVERLKKEVEEKG